MCTARFLSSIGNRCPANFDLQTCKSIANRNWLKKTVSHPWATIAFMPIETDESYEEYGRPLVLIVPTNGMELQLLLPPMDARAVHSCLPWKPTPCRCGATHTTSEPFDLVVFVGRPDLTLKTDPGSTTVYVVPAKTDHSLLQHPVIVAYDDQDFGPWAAAVLFNFVCGISITGLIG
jgi:hypothetical protein